MSRTLVFIALLTATMVAPAAAETYKMTTPIAPGIATPDEVETSIGTLKLHDGVPSAETTEAIYDNLDRSRAFQAYLLGIPIVNQVAMRNALREYGPVNTTDVMWEDLVDSKTVELTANDNTVYSFIWIDTTKGPLVVEIPPKVLGAIDDMWYRWVADVGITGADHGKGGKYLILPPGYKGEVPDGYFVVRPSTFGNWMPFRSFLVDGSPKPGVRVSPGVMSPLSSWSRKCTSRVPGMEVIVSDPQAASAFATLRSASGPRQRYICPYLAPMSPSRKGGLRRSSDKTNITRSHQSQPYTVNTAVRFGKRPTDIIS
jgi:hypothetical protein